MSTTPTYPEQNLISTGVLKASDARIREAEFVSIFNENIKKLVEALGVTRKIPKQAGTTLKAYKATGTLLDGSVPEGDIIPLSKYQVEPVSYVDITLKKWRKATSAEAIVEYGYDQAHDMTSDRMIKDVQGTIKKAFFDFLATGNTSVAATTFQGVIAKTWGQLQVLFEDDDVQVVHFINPLDVADYLSTAQISLQTAFGMSYVEDFLGMGTVILNAAVPKGTIYSTAKENIVLYYIPVNGADLGEAFQFTSDALGLIGIHETADYTTMTTSDTVMSGIVLFADRIDGVVIGTIGSNPAPVVYTEDELNTMTVKDLKALADKLSVSLEGKTSKEEIIAAIVAK